ncbi:Transport protein particle 33 kDa subunit [Kluyveromyces marxianus]|nr:Trafficking protein particle complex subunit 33 [Kluyveromyces marxianus]KAG0682986.1 Trafficking protein particle complex subunit 33 [Kluyveromyces marxianus]
MSSANTHHVASESPEQIERRRIIEQFLLFQESLPKVNVLSYQWLLNEMIPMSMAVEHNLGSMDDSSSTSSQEEEDQAEALADDVSKVSLNKVNYVPSHKLIQELYNANDEQRERVYERLFKIGKGIGSKITELLIFSNNPNLSFSHMDTLGMVRFICKEVWKLLYGKQIDNLKTNHRGVFYLFDYEFEPIQNFSIDDDEEKLLKMVAPYVQVPLGVISGILTSLGVPEDELSVSFSYTDIPDNKKKPLGQFPKGLNFNIQINQFQQNPDA